MSTNKTLVGVTKTNMKTRKSQVGTLPVYKIGNTPTSNFETITLLGKKFEIDMYLNDTMKFHLAQIDFHGILFYKSLKNMNIIFYIKEISEFLDTLLITQERNTQLENILEKIN